ncbi:conjugal transfer protein TraL (plasmid) [Yersinia pseudotuberculosis IP 31758]|uniref:Conjugal transfer protein TraL n=2 Tax=Yersinia TaxID=629 RepID=A0A0U1QT91_YERP3|nr:MULTISPECIES: conjugal transfer protein TraL [Yersinia]ABS45600.1 conjugal transfer protein TraL [Yersinia pseudotuberculosis IP 31758]AVX40756.1 conjugal transfer protein TraL [Yersinia massiliensis]
MANIHMVLQGKGGVGKSFISSLIAQYMASSGQLPLCVDTDPVNASFLGYKALKVRRLEIMEGDEVNTRNFDELVEWIAETKVDMVIDNGASSFIPLSSYLVSNAVPGLLQEMSHQLIIHSVVTGGQALPETLAGLESLVKWFPDETIFIVWLNPYWGPIIDNGKTFEEMPVYEKYKERISAIIHLPELKEETYGKDLTDMLQARLTFDQALKMKDLSIMTRQRLKMIQKLVYNQLDLLAKAS